MRARRLSPTVDLVRDGLASNAVDIGALMIKGLREMAQRQSLVRDVRGLGLMIGLEFETAEVADAVQLGCFHRGALVLRAGEKTVRISPPLLIDSEQAANGLAILEEVCTQLGANNSRT